jgi:hypothetical protein
MKKTCSFSLIERVILSAGAMLIFSVSFQIDQVGFLPGERKRRAREAVHLYPFWDAESKAMCWSLEGIEQ